MIEMSPLNYIVKSGAATLAELSALTRASKFDVDTLKTWAAEEIAFRNANEKAPAVVSE